MIMEHFLGKDFEGMYRNKCWICGCEEMGTLQKLPTVRGVKYHVVCSRCKEFWVENHCYSCGRRELGKHLHNYYREQDGSIWNVVCPECGAML